MPESLRDKRGLSGSGRRQSRGWVKGLVIGWSGALISAYMAWRTDDIRHLNLEDPSLRWAVMAIFIVILFSFSGFALFRLRKLSQGNSWVESRWKPTSLAWLSVAVSLCAAMWSGYLIAIRVARDLTL